MSKTQDRTFADDLREMMAAWDTIEAAARARHPLASEDEIHRLTAGAMDHALGMRR